MAELSKKITVNGADGKPIVFEVDAVVTQWHAEKMNEIYQPYMHLYDSEKKELNLDSGQRIKLNQERETKMIETFIRSWDRGIALTPENIKRNLLETDYVKLVHAIQEVNDGDLSEEKKSPSQENSSSASTPTETQTEQ